MADGRSIGPRDDDVRTPPSSDGPPASGLGRSRRGRRGPTSQDVAERAGVSRTVVSFVLNNRPHTGIPEETRQRVLRAVAELAYRPNNAARSLASGRTGTLSVVIGDAQSHAYGDAFLPELLRGIDRTTRTAGFRILLEYVDGSSLENPYLAAFREGHVDGLIICGPRADGRDLADLIEAAVPAIVIGDPGAANCLSVDVDNVEAARGAVSHLIEHGYRRIGLITNLPLSFASSRARAAGYRLAMADGNLPVDEDLIVEGGLDEVSGQETMARLLRLVPRPRAVFAASDQIAMGALVALRVHGLRAPDDVAIVGFDDLPAASQVDPSLTTVRVPAPELGQLASQRLLDLLAGRFMSEPRTILPTQLMLRESCGLHA
ncbi:MAG TPA: LacI family DNA-binding transcriptional regulator [Chloroflexota bacterium]|nr:LacI family DNA-binding transcriptional regulator [Chloroflexota bacterium]